MSFFKWSKPLAIAILFCAFVPSPLDVEMQPQTPPVGFFSPEGSKLAVVEDENTLEVISMTDGSAIFSKSDFVNLNLSVVWNPNDLGIAVTDAYDLLIWDDVTQSGNATPSRTLKYYEVLGITPNTYAYYVAWSPNGQFIALSVGSYVFVWNGTSGEHLYTMDASYLDPETWEQNTWGFVDFLDWIDNERLIFGDTNGRLYVYSLIESEVTKIYIAPVVNQYTPIITAVALSHSRNRLAIAEEYLQAGFIWEFEEASAFETGPESNFFFGHGENRVSAIAWRSDDALVASLGEDRVLRVWNPDMAQEYTSVMLPDDASVNTLSWSADGSAVSYLNLAGDFETIQITGVPTMTLPHAEMQSTFYPVGFFSPTKSKVAIIKDENTLEVISMTDGSAIFSKSDFVNLNLSVVWNPNDLGIAVTDAYDLLIWDDVTQSGNTTPSRTLKYYEVLGITPKMSANDAAWSPNSQFVALSVGSSIFVWDGTTGQHISTITDAYIDQVTGEQEFWDFVRFLYWPENEHLVFADASGRLYVYSLTESEVTKIYIAPVVNQYTPIITAVALSHSRNRLAIAEEYLQASFIWEFEEASAFETGPSSDFFFGHGENRVSAMAWRDDDAVVASLSEDRVLRFWNPDTAQEYTSVMLPDDASVNTLSWSEDGSSIDYVTLAGEIVTVEINGVPTMNILSVTAMP